jgi:hypothetical protein
MTGKTFAVLVSASLLAGSVAFAQQQTTEKTMAQEKATSTTQNHKTWKSKSKTVIGTVKEYQAGEKLEVTGPKSKEYTFDLDQSHTTATVDPSVAVGTRVKVVSKTDTAGKTTITVKPYGHHGGMSGMSHQ